LKDNQINYNLSNKIFQVKFFNLSSLKGGVPINSNLRYKCSSVSTNQKSGGIPVNLNFELKIKAQDSNREIFEQIKKLLGGHVSYDKLKNEYIYSSGSFGSARQVIKYFDNFHLQSRKYVSYLK
jgi:hypothetical protein